jgi:hypothetical protein
MSLLNSIQSDSSVKTEDKDVLGGRSLLPTNIYVGKLDAVWLSASASGAIAVNISANIDGKNIRQTSYITNAKKEDFYIDKKTSEKKAMPSVMMFNALVKLVTGKNSYRELTTEKRTLSIWNPDQKKEVATAVDCFVELHGAEVGIAVEHQIVDKSEKGNGGKYFPTGETREQNEITKFFDAATMKTVTELLGNADASFAGKWLEKNKDKVIDKESAESKKIRETGKGAKAGLPASSGAGGSPATDEDLFGD